jgi:hypothetical protein
VLGWAETPHAGKQPRNVRAYRVDGDGVALSIDGQRPAVVIDHGTAKILAAFLVALSSPEGTDSA